jgi:hypothetical protein
MLELSNLHARVVPEDGPARDILKGLSLKVPRGEENVRYAACSCLSSIRWRSRACR